MEQLHRWSCRLGDGLFALALLATFLMMLHVTVDVIARTFFNHPLPGTNELTASYYMVAIALLPWAYVNRVHGHISAELFTQRMSPRTQALLKLVMDLLTAAYMALFTWQSWVSAMSNTESKEVWQIPGGFLPVWPTRWFVAAAGAAMTLYLVTHMLRQFSAPADTQEAL